MKRSQVLWLVVALLVSATIAVSYNSSRIVRQSTSPIHTEASPPTESKKYSTVDYDSSEPLAAKEKERRKLKNQRYDNDSWVQRNPHPETGMIGRHTEATPPPVMPTQESDLIVTGRVIDVTTYLSNDKSGVYSEYKIKIYKSLKKAGEVDTATGFITVDRAGGMVRYPNNQTVIYLHSDFGLPEVGNEYVLFLYNDKKSGNFKVITLYELLESETVPLDVGRNMDDIRRMSKSDFIKAIQEKLLPGNAESRRNP